MRITVCGLNFGLTSAIVRHVERRIRLSLGRVCDRVDAVCVRLGDINGSRGGVDKRCGIVLRLLRPLSTVVVDALDRDLYAAVDGAARGAREAVWRQIRRRRTLQRQGAGASLRRAAAL